MKIESNKDKFFDMLVKILDKKIEMDDRDIFNKLLNKRISYVGNRKSGRK